MKKHADAVKIWPHEVSDLIQPLGTVGQLISRHVVTERKGIRNRYEGNYASRYLVAVT
jgi:hypothetical protein